MIAIASCKGGVGKSTTAVNLALSLLAAHQGETIRVGLLDADIHGPSQSIMLGITQRAEVKPGKQFVPIMRYGLQTMSISYLIDNNAPMIWRGPMISKALQQLMHDTCWDGDLDYLVLDLPPGTGDIYLTLIQKMPLSGAIIVTTPQDVALIDAKKGLAMFQKTQVPILGMIENMSGYQCSACGHQEGIFGESRGQQIATSMGIPLLGTIPIDATLCQQMDRGCPPVVCEPDGSIAKQYANIAQHVITRLEETT